MKENRRGFVKKNSFRVLAVISMIFATFNAEARLTLREIRSASKDVLVVFFTSDTLNLTEVDISNVSEWKINGRPCKSIYRYSTKADMCDHHIYLQTTDLVEGREYELITPYGSRKFKFDSRTIFCESIKTNQAGYSSLSKVRYANFTIWLGTGGSRKIDGPLPAWEVFNMASGKTIARGMLEEKGMDSTSGGVVYRIDLGGVPEGGPYKIAVKGYGCSWPFGVGGEFMKRAAYITFRGQFYQRCGCPIDNPDIRKHACHTIVYDVDGPIGEANIVVQGNEPTFKCYGGYHDAGDADRRAYHISNPMVNLMAYEAFPQMFFDGQFDIPGDFDSEYNIINKKNEVPDIIDEAAWGTLVWEYLQNEDGSIHFGTETKGYPDPFAAPMDLDNKKYGTVRIDNRATCPAAGLFLHLARIIKPYNPEKSKELMIRADKAFAFGSSAMAGPEKLYYHLQRYLLTRDESDHQKVKELYTIAGSLKDNLFGTVGYSLNDKLFDNPAYIFSYIVAKDVPTDPEIVSFFRSALKDAAEANIAELRKRAFPVGNTPEKGGWGHNVRQNHFATASMLMWSLTGEQKYIDAASELLDYKMGLNPIGISYVTQLGFHQVHNPHDRESAYTAGLGLGPKPGITVFGPGVTGRRTAGIPVIPQISELAKERQYVDDREIISFNEFTIFETLAHDAWYTVLASGGKWNGKDPFESFPQEPGSGYILETRDNKVYLDFKEGEVEAGNRLNVIRQGGYFIHPVSGDSIKEEDYIISQLIIDEVKRNYSIANAMPPESISLLEKGMKVLRIGNPPVQHKELVKSFSIKPLQGSRTYGFLWKYANDFLTEYLLKNNSVRVFDPGSEALQTSRNIIDTSIVITDSVMEHNLSVRLPEYEITSIIYEPFVLDLSTQKQLKTHYINNAYGHEMPYGRNKTVRALKNYSPEKAEIKRLRAVIKVALQISSVKTGEIVFFCTEMQEYEASGDINIERGFLTGVSVPGGNAAFKNTVTGKAVELAIQNLSGYLTAFFDGKIDSSSYTGNVINLVNSDYKIMISDLKQKEDLPRIKFISKPETVYHVILNSGRNMNVRNKDYLDICLTPDKSTESSVKHSKKEKIGYLRVSETNIETSEGDAVFKYNINPADFNKDESYLRIKNRWNTVFFLARIPTFRIKDTNIPDLTEKEITYSGIGYMLNYKVGFYSYLGYGNTILKSGTTSTFSTYYGGLGITKSIGRNTNIGAGLTFHYGTVKYLGSSTIHSIDLLGSTRLKNNLNIIYGCSVPKENQENLFLSLGVGYSF